MTDLPLIWKLVICELLGASAAFSYLQWIAKLKFVVKGRLLTNARARINDASDREMMRGNIVAAVFTWPFILIGAIAFVLTNSIRAAIQLIKG